MLRVTVNSHPCPHPRALSCSRPSSESETPAPSSHTLPGASSTGTKAITPLAITLAGPTAGTGWRDFPELPFFPTFISIFCF